MKADQIKVGQHYLAKVSNNVVPVRVDRVEVNEGFHSPSMFSAHRRRVPTKTVYHCTNTKTNRQIVVRSAQRFRAPCNADGSIGARFGGVRVKPEESHEPDSRFANKEGGWL